jgi:hypothetical protein
VKLSQALQETLLDAVASKPAGTHVEKIQRLEVSANSSGAEDPQGREESPESGDRAEGTAPVQGRKRRSSVDLGIDRSAAKRARLAQTHTKKMLEQIIGIYLRSFPDLVYDDAPEGRDA